MITLNITCRGKLRYYRSHTNGKHFSFLELRLFLSPIQRDSSLQTFERCLCFVILCWTSKFAFAIFSSESYFRAVWWPFDFRPKNEISLRSTRQHKRAQENKNHDFDLSRLIYLCVSWFHRNKSKFRRSSHQAIFVMKYYSALMWILPYYLCNGFPLRMHCSDEYCWVTKIKFIAMITT